MKNRKGFLCLLIFLSLLGCHRINTYTYFPPYAWTGKICITQCVARRAHCMHTCAVQKEHCVAHPYEDAYYRYQIYHDEQLASHRVPAKFVWDFNQSGCCNNIICNCQTNFDICYRDCGGKILVGKKLV